MNLRIEEAGPAPAVADDAVSISDEARLRREQAKRFQWLNFTDMASYADADIPLIVRSEGLHLWDDEGTRYIDAMAGLCCVNIGHGRPEPADAAARQMKELTFSHLWANSHPTAAALAARIAALAPGDLNRVLFTSGGSETVDAALKLARQYHHVRGDGRRSKVLGRHLAYHGSTFYSGTVTSLTYAREPFEPLVPGVSFFPTTNAYRNHLPWTAEALIEPLIQAIEFEGPETIAAVIVEPVQSTGSLVAPPGYYERMREVCDQHGILLIADEVITAWGRVGEWFASTRYNLQPDIITTAKGLTSAYAPVGALIASDRVMQAFIDARKAFAHGYTFAGHPAMAAVALANIDILEGEGLIDRVRTYEEELRTQLESLYDIPILGDVRGDGYLYSIELVKNRETRQTFDRAETALLTGDLVSGGLKRRGLLCRTDTRAFPAVAMTIAPPLTAGPEDFAEIIGILRPVLEEASAYFKL